MANTRLNFLEDLDDYKVASNDPDVRGWEVVDKHQNKLGTVEHLLADVERKRVRYLDIDPDKELLNEEGNTYEQSSNDAHEYRDRDGDVHIILPIGMARLDSENHRVITDKVDKETFMATPRLQKGEPVTIEEEKKVRTYFEDPGSYRDGHSPDMQDTDSGEVTYKSEHHTKGNENLGTRDPDKRRDVSSERSTAGSPEDRTPGEESREDNIQGRKVSTDDNKHQQKITPENSGVPRTHSRAKDVDSSPPNREQKSETSSEGSTDRISQSDRSMRPEKSNKAKMTKGAPDSLEAGATSAGAQAGSIEPRTTSDRENMRSQKTDTAGELGKDPQVRETEYSGKAGEGKSDKDKAQSSHKHRESDESAARRKQSGDTTDEDFYEGQNYDSERFYNRK